MSTTKSQSITGLIIKLYPEGDRPKYTIIRAIINAICISVFFFFSFLLVNAYLLLTHYKNVYCLNVRANNLSKTHT